MVHVNPTVDLSAAQTRSGSRGQAPRNNSDRGGRPRATIRIAGAEPRATFPDPARDQRPKTKDQRPETRDQRPETCLPARLGRLSRPKHAACEAGAVRDRRSARRRAVVEVIGTGRAFERARRDVLNLLRLFFAVAVVVEATDSLARLREALRLSGEGIVVVGRAVAVAHRLAKRNVEVDAQAAAIAAREAIDVEIRPQLRR